MGAVAVGRCEANEEVLPRQVRRRLREREAEGLDALGLGSDSDDGGALPGADARGSLVRGADIAGSIALVALLEPGVAAVVVAPFLPESWLIVIEQT